MSRRAALLATAVGLAACAGMASAAVVQEGNLRITVLSQILPYKLPRNGTAPIAVFVSGHLDAPTGGIPAQLQEMTVKVNKHGLLQSKGLPTCKLSEIQPASTERALQSCGDAVVGSGQFWAHIVLPDQGAYATHGRLLIFNGRQKGKPGTADPHLHRQPLLQLLRHPLRDQEDLQGRLRHRALRLASPSPGQLGLRRPDQAHPEAQIHLQGQAAELLQRRLPRSGGIEADGLPPGPGEL